MTFDKLKSHKRETNETAGEHSRTWEIKKLGEICENLDSKRIPITQRKRTKGDIPYYGASGIVDSVSDYIFDEDLLCVSEDGANLLARTYPIAFSISGKTWVNNHAHVLRFKNFTTQKFVEIYLNSIRIDDYVGGMAQPKLNQAMLNKIPIPLPPLPEQQRIVSILDEAFACIERSRNNAERCLSLSKALFESYLQGVFENGNWETKKLNEITEVKDGTHDSPKYNKEGIPFVTQKNIKPDGLSFDDTKFITDIDHEKFYKRSNVTYGDILISMIGANRGMAAIVDDKRVFSIKNVGLIKSSDNINMNYLLYFLKSSIAMKYVLYMSNGGAQEFVGLTALRNFPIPLPLLKEQQTIVRQLDALRAETKKLEAVYQKKLDDLEELKKSILQKAFAGELRGGEPVEPKTEKVVAV